LHSLTKKNKEKENKALAIMPWSFNSDGDPNEL
jgi:hypothetical protein